MNEDKKCFRIKVNGVFVGGVLSEMAIALEKIGHLPKEQQVVAEIVPVTPDGRELLFG